MICKDNAAVQASSIPKPCAAAIACQLRAYLSPENRPKSNRERGFRESRNQASRAGGVLSCSARAPSIARTRGGSESATLSKCSRHRFSDSSASVRRAVFSGDISLVLPPCRKKSSKAASVSDSCAQAAGRRVWTIVSSPISFRGRLRAMVATSPRLAVCVVNPIEIGGGNPGRKDCLRSCRQFLNCGRIGTALAECCLPAAVVDSFAQSLERSLAAET